ncbi:PAS domain S-box-containing protein [Scopulibacillus darangshiensis]|uniref:HTH-type transcriptional regulatory protein TyrR n=1 Tax=Scopulibacillus darangshiensis TaxID=442528 RepID=A0A4V2SJZ5_9BACL|nr:sigma 54-interacting transcriptional regulator [Scopulibacillus darangshiensis]TCP17536.1 PAS domain S-box-containing protein [Scopulibacillus darangshiensis]
MQRIQETIEMSVEKFQKLLDYSSDEIFVLDHLKRIVYVNKVCERHYGLKPDDVIGRYNADFFKKGYWKPSIVPLVFEQKKPVSIKQTTYIGGELLTTAIPILNEQDDIEFVVVTAQELHHLKLIRDSQDDDGGQYLLDSEEPSNLAFFTNCETMKKVIGVCKKIANVNSTVLIQGESGTGKGVLAHYIHQISQRNKGPFLKINCAAIPEHLLESELFGYSKGAFTGASERGKQGLVEQADNGTLFLDEIGETSLKIQAKLLELIQEHQFIPVGGRKPKKVNIRIIAATNRGLSDMVQNKEFREDLFYRLNVIDLKIPPLRERYEDIIPLTYYFLNAFNKKYDVNQLISQECLNIIANYHWPGNIRQLENVIERLVITSESLIKSEDLPSDIYESGRDLGYQLSSYQSLDDAISGIEKEMIRKSYKKHHSSRKVAVDLKISQTRANNLIRSFCQDLKK